MRWILLLLPAAAAVAEDKIDGVFQVWDADKDGVLSREEVPDPAIFAQVDADKDGRVTRAEVAAFLGLPAPKPEAPAKTEKPEAAPKPKEAERPGTPPAAGAPAAPQPEEGKSDAGIAEPRTVKERVEDLLRRFDQDKNGRIERKEWAAGEQVFVDWDKNRDEALAPRELTRYVTAKLRDAKRRPNTTNFFDLFDMNRDKKVSRAEYDGPSDFFRRYDHDRDRTVTEEELFMGPDAGMVMEGDRDFLTDGPTPMPRQTLLDRYDADKNGRITLEELGGAESVLHRLDKNGDGVLSGPEVR
jgi:Ca2+-binding EF-hand superfamily protein